VRPYGGATTTGTDHLFFSVYYGNVTGCTKAAATACVLDYNVSTPLTGTANTPVGELPIVAAGTNGCFSTGAIVVDTSPPRSRFTGLLREYEWQFNGGRAHRLHHGDGQNHRRCAGWTGFAELTVRGCRGRGWPIHGRDH